MAIKTRKTRQAASAQSDAKPFSRGALASLIALLVLLLVVLISYLFLYTQFHAVSVVPSSQNLIVTQSGPANASGVFNNTNTSATPPLLPP
jgi:hypothetical protein